MEEIVEVTPGLQCCLRCGRVLTDRALHDALEEPVLASIRREHGVAPGADEACEACLEEYRSLLQERRTRASREVAEAEHRPATRLGRWFGRRSGAVQHSARLAP